MGIKRTALEFETEFTRVPNAWARDARLSRRARGLLVELMSHRVGWHVTISSLQKSGTEGRDAIRSAVQELVALDYLLRVQGRAAGRFNEIEYELHDPTVVGFSDTGGFSDDGLADVGESDTKKNIPLEDQELEPPLFCDQHPNGGVYCGFCKDAKRIHEKWMRSHSPAAKQTLSGIVTPQACRDHGYPIGTCPTCDKAVAA